MHGMQTCSPTSCRAASPCSGLLSSCHGRNSLHKPCMTVQAHAQGRYPFATPSDQLKQPSCRGCGKHGVAVQTENRRVQWQQPHARSRRQCSRTPASASTQSTGVSVFPAGGCCMYAVLSFATLAMQYGNRGAIAVLTCLECAQAKARRRCGYQLCG